jgi:pilus assembly protein Flp/PilA
MKFAVGVVFRLRRLWVEVQAQDLIEYALMAGFVALAAGALMPGVANSISTIFSKITSVMADAAREPSG